MVTTIGRIERVPLREVWPHEAHHFTAWLERNSDVLSEHIGGELSGIQREAAAGAFSVDLVAEDEAGNLFVIENQLERSDHDHLGKLITYAAAYEASTAIWIVADARPEHVQAITWLNETTPTAFYLLKLDAVRIADSPPAPHLTLIVGPSDQGRQVGETKREFSERHQLRRQFWIELLERALPHTKRHANISPGTTTNLHAASGIPGVSFYYASSQQESRVGVYINRNDPDENKRLFDLLFQHKAHIEQELDSAMHWARNDEGRASWMYLMVAPHGYDAPDDERARVQEMMVDAMVRLEAVFVPLLAQLNG